MKVASPKAFGIYIHWPYCEAKCPYCDFNSYARRTISEAQFLEAITKELTYYAALTEKRTVTSIFFGGGTPSLMAAATVSKLIDTIAHLWPISPICEITLEANPSSVEADRFASYKIAGVNRVSLGVQSLRDDQLRFLGRLHNADEARQAIKIAAHHFDRYSFDLIYARPDQTLSEWRDELEDALQLANGHLSLYQLTIEPETAFFNLAQRGKLQIPLPDNAADLYELTQDLCNKASLPSYETSNHAKAGHEGVHNLGYWRYHDYIGVGPGAHGRITIGDERQATVAHRQPQMWYDAVLECGHGATDVTSLPKLERAQEMVLMGLRIIEGVQLNRLHQETGFDLDPQSIQPLISDRLIDIYDGFIRLTPPARLVLNAVTQEVVKALRPVSN